MEWMSRWRMRRGRNRLADEAAKEGGKGAVCISFFFFAQRMMNFERLVAAAFVGNIGFNDIDE